MAAMTKTEAQSNRKEAQLMHYTRYQGRSCKRHPELDGIRSTCNCVCIGCARELDRMKYPARAQRLKLKRAGVI